MTQQTISAGEDVEKWETFCSVNGNVDCCGTVQNRMEFPQKNKNESAFDPAIPLLRM